MVFPGNTPNKRVESDSLRRRFAPPPLAAHAPLDAGVMLDAYEGSIAVQCLPDPQGDNIYSAIVHGLGAAHTMVFCLSLAALRSNWLNL